MTPIKEIGEFVLADGNKEFFFRPSFAAMIRIGDSEQIVATYVKLRSDNISAVLNSARDMHMQMPESQRRAYATINHSIDMPISPATDFIEERVNLNRLFIPNPE